MRLVRSSPWTAMPVVLVAASLLAAAPVGAELNKCQKDISKNHAKISADVQKELQKCADFAQKDLDKGKTLRKAAEKCERSLGKIGLGPQLDALKSKIQKGQTKIRDALPGGARARCEDADLVALGVFPTASHGTLSADLLAIGAARTAIQNQTSSNPNSVNLFEDMASDFCVESGRSCDLTADAPDASCESVTRFCKRNPTVACTADSECQALDPRDKCDSLDAADVCQASTCPTCTLFARRDREGSTAVPDPPSEGFPATACRDVSCKVGGATAIGVNLAGGAAIPVGLGGNLVLSACDLPDVSPGITAVYGANARTLRASLPGVADICVDVVSATGYIDNAGTIPEFGFANCFDAVPGEDDDCDAAGFPAASCQLGGDNEAAPTGPTKQCLAPVPAAPAAGSSNLVVSSILNIVVGLSGEAGVDGIPCTADDTSAPGAVQNLTLTTGDATSVYFDSAGGGAALGVPSIGPLTVPGAAAPGPLADSGDTLVLTLGAAFASNTSTPIIGENIATLAIECTP